MKIVITSMGRADRIDRYTLKLFPDALLCCPEDELSQYSKVVDSKKIITHPTGLNSHVAAIQWALDRIDDEVVWSVDDDLIALISNTHRTVRKYTDPADIMQVLENTIEMARGAGAHLCGFSMSGDPKAYVSFDPIRLCATVNGACWGFIGRSIPFDNRAGVNGDVDMVLEHLRKHRIVFVDQRFFFQSVLRNSSTGGGAVWRSEEEYKRGQLHLRRKWGQYIQFGWRVKDGGKGLARARTTSIAVRRRQLNVTPGSSIT